MEETLWGSTDLEQPKYDAWTAVAEDDNVKMVDRPLRQAIRHYLSLKDSRDADTARITKLETDYAALLKDYKSVNHHINAYADEMRMCPDYERRIFSWNDGGVNGQDALTHKLTGRPATYYVYVSVPQLSEGELYVDVTATSEQEAEEMVRNMTQADVLAKIMATGPRLNSLEITVNRARR
jgi:hypothetical protein